MKRTLITVAVLVSAVASAAEWKVERDAAGVPRIWRDGTAVEPWIFCFARATPGRELELKSVADEIRLARRVGTRIYSVSMEPVWGSKDPKAWDYADFQMKTILDNDPDAVVLPRIQTHNPPWLRDTLVERNLSSQGRRDLASVCSPRCRADCRAAIREFVARMEAKYGDHMFGYQVAGGHHGEFQYLNFGWQGNYLGYDEGTKRAFKAKTGFDVPSPERRSGRIGAAFYDPVADRDIVAFNRFLGDEMADWLLEMAHEVRVVCGRKRVVAAFYGYLFECYAQRVGPSSSGHFALQKVLQSPDVDLLCGPYSYNNDSRCPGNPATTHTVGESVTAHGKIWINEDDTATHISMQRREPEDGSGRNDWTRSLDETKMLIRRNFAFSLARNYGTWWFDHHSHGMWNDPALWEERARFERLAAALGPSPYCGEVRLVFQERMTDYCVASAPSHYQLQEGAYMMRAIAARCGCSVETVLLEDILDGTVKDDGVKLEIFLNATALTGKEREFLRKRAERIASVWLWTPGWIDLDRGQGSTAAVEELTGFRVKEVATDSWTVFTRPYGMDYAMPMIWGFGKTFGPVLAPELREGDRFIANWKDNWSENAAVMRPGKDGRVFAFFSGTPALPTGGIRSLAREAGATVRCSRDAAVDVRGGMRAITVGEGGVYDFLVGDGEWFDLVTGKMVGRGPKLVLDLSRQSTTVLLDRPTFERFEKGVKVGVSAPHGRDGAPSPSGRVGDTCGAAVGGGAPSLPSAWSAKNVYVGTEPSKPVWQFSGRTDRCGISYDHGWQYPGLISSVSYVVEVTLDGLPAKGEVACICGRTGYHNALVVDSEGRLDFGCFNRKGDRSANAKSKTRLVPGRKYRLAAIVDCSYGNETRLRLSVDGKLEAERVAFEGPPFDYPWRIWVGQLGERDGKPYRPINGVVSAFRCHLGVVEVE